LNFPGGQNPLKSLNDPKPDSGWDFGKAKREFKEWKYVDFHLYCCVNTQKYKTNVTGEIVEKVS